MQAIVIKEPGAFKHLHGHTFEVKRDTLYLDLDTNRVRLTIIDAAGSTNIDFDFKNVIFVNAQDVAQELYDARNWGTTGALKAWNGFKRWAYTHGFEFNPQYNCPA